jgi:hypothetical protein
MGEGGVGLSPFEAERGWLLTTNGRRRTTDFCLLTTDFLSQPGEDFPGAVVGHAVGHDHLESAIRFHLVQR